MHRTPTFFLLLFTSAGMGCSACSKEAPRAPAPTAVPVELTVAAPTAVSLPADRPGRPSLGRFAVGINEGVSIPQALVRREGLPPEQEAGLLAADVADLVDLGAGVVRANTATYPWLSWFSSRKEADPFRRADAWVQAVTASDLEPLMMVGPWPGNRTANHTDHYLPDDMGAYTSWLQAVVERYDGDGVDDMPGLRRPVRYWEVDNEPDLHNSVPPRGGSRQGDPTTFQTPAEYAQVLVASAAAIRAADPQAVVLSAGFYRPHTAPGRDWIERWLAEPGVRDAFDVLSLHCYFDGDSLDRVDRTLDTWRATAPDKPMWVTETSVPSDGKGRWIDQDWQAGMVPAVIGGFLAGGADRVFWHTLADPPPSPEARKSPFAAHSLRQASAGPDRTTPGPTSDKPSGAVFRRMMAHLGPTDPATFQGLVVDGGRLLRAGDGWLAYWGRPAVPSGATLVEDLRTGEQHAPGSHVQAPAWISGPAPTTPPSPTDATPPPEG